VEMAQNWEVRKYYKHIIFLSSLDFLKVWASGR
jgi:hypothetical protein